MKFYLTFVQVSDIRAYVIKSYYLDAKSMHIFKGIEFMKLHSLCNVEYNIL